MLSLFNIRTSSYCTRKLQAYCTTGSLFTRVQSIGPVGPPVLNSNVMMYSRATVSELTMSSVTSSIFCAVAVATLLWRDAESRNAAGFCELTIYAVVDLPRR